MLRSVDSVAISIDDLLQTRRALREDPILHMAVSVLKHHLLSAGVDIHTKKRKRRTANNKTEDDTQQVRWTVFLERALEEIMCWGFVVFHEDFSEVDLRRCTVEMNRNTREITVKSTSMSPVTAINAFGYSPSFQGELTSIIAALVPWIEFIKRLRCSVLTLEDKKIIPDMVYEKLPTKENDDDIIGQEYYANADDMGRRQDQQYYMPQQERQDYERACERDLQKINRLCGRDTVPSNTVTIPEGHKLAHIGTAQGRSDIVGMMRMVQQLICATVGVPRTMLINDGVARADTSATHARFRTTCRVFKRHLNHILTVLNPTGHATLHDVFYGPPETLTQMWLMGILSDEQYSTYFTQLYGIQGTQNLIHIDKEQLATDCMRNLVTQHHGRT